MKAVEIDFGRLESRLRNGETVRAIAREYGISHQTLSERRRRNGGKRLGHGVVNGGNKFVDRHGYVLIRVANHRRVNPYVPEHILIAERKLGRSLLPGEVVHHINGNKRDNRLENLYVCSRSRHRELHRSLEAIAMELVNCGELEFSTEGYKWASHTGHSLRE